MSLSSPPSPIQLNALHSNGIEASYNSFPLPSLGNTKDAVLLGVSSVWLWPEQDEALNESSKENKECSMSNGRQKNKIRSAINDSGCIAAMPPVIVKRKRSVSRTLRADDLPALLFHDADIAAVGSTKTKPNCDYGFGQNSPTSVAEELRVLETQRPVFCRSTSLPDHAIAPARTPPPIKRRPRRWRSFHEDGRDWGTSGGCNSKIIEQLLAQFELQENDESV